MRERILGIIIVVLLIGFGFSAGMATGLYAQQEAYRTKAIEHGCAGYNSKTGAFQWNMEKMK